MENLSFLRKNWEDYFLEIVKKRISEDSISKDELLIISDQKNLDQILNTGRLDKKIKYVIISLPLNNFENLVHFFKKIDKVLDDETKIIINYFSSLWSQELPSQHQYHIPSKRNHRSRLESGPH